jgi:DNA polymerase-3 subunit gamma/tau
MEDFIVSARKYRPLSFDDVVGQLHITGTLRNALTNKKIPHALLFCGPRGVGKTTCARILAKSINCMNPSAEMEPCGTCDSCVGFQTSHSFNIHELDAASNNSVEGIRDLIGQVRIPPQVGSHSVYIIDEVHMLSAAAFNAFLKTLEEPPAHAVFILATTEKHKILPTILSRCQIFDFRRITVDDITGHLMKIAMKENIEAAEEGLHVIAMKADGALRDALSIFDRIVTFSGNAFGYKEVIENLNILDYDYHFQLVEMARANQSSELLLKLDEILQLGFDGAYLLGGLCEHLRNLLVVHSPSTVKLLEATEALRDRYVQQSQQFSLETKLALLDLMNAADAQYRVANNKRLHLELALLKMAAFLQPNSNPPAGPSSTAHGNAASKAPAAVSASTASNSASNVLKAKQEAQLEQPSAPASPEASVAHSEANVPAPAHSPPAEIPVASAPDKAAQLLESASELLVTEPATNQTEPISDAVETNSSAAEIRFEEPQELRDESSPAVETNSSAAEIRFEEPQELRDESAPAVEINSSAAEIRFEEPQELRDESSPAVETNSLAAEIRFEEPEELTETSAPVSGTNAEANKIRFDEPMELNMEVAQESQESASAPKPDRAQRRRSQLNTGTLSIKDEIARLDKTEDVFVPKADAPFDMEQLRKAVLDFSQQLNAQGKMVASQMLSRVDFNQTAPTSIVFYVPHAGLQSTFVEISSDLLAHLRSALNNDFIELFNEIKASESSARPYTPEEKFNAMAESNPSLIDLKNAFNFEIKP